MNLLITGAWIGVKDYIEQLEKRTCCGFYAV